MKTPSNPSRRATARVRDPLPVPKICHLCGGQVECCENKVIYGRNFGDWPWIYRCSSCGARVGLHPFTAIPLGTLADDRTREARIAAKAVFQDWRENHRLDRSEAYAALAKEMGIPRNECHFGWFDEARCGEAREAIARLSHQDRGRREEG